MEHYFIENAMHGGNDANDGKASIGLDLGDLTQITWDGVEEATLQGSLPLFADFDSEIGQYIRLGFSGLDAIFRCHTEIVQESQWFLLLQQVVSGSAPSSGSYSLTSCSDGPKASLDAVLAVATALDRIYISEYVSAPLYHKGQHPAKLMVDEAPIGDSRVVSVSSLTEFGSLKSEHLR